MAVVTHVEIGVDIDLHGYVLFWNSSHADDSRGIDAERIWLPVERIPINCVQIAIHRHDMEENKVAKDYFITCLRSCNTKHTDQCFFNFKCNILV